MPKIDLVKSLGFVLIGPIAVCMMQSPLPVQGEENAACALEKEKHKTKNNKMHKLKTKAFLTLLS